MALLKLVEHRIVKTVKTSVETFGLVVKLSCTEVCLIDEKRDGAFIRSRDDYLSLVRERTKRTCNRTIFQEFSLSNSFVSLLFSSEASTLSFVSFRDSKVLPFAAPNLLNPSLSS